MRTCPVCSTTFWICQSCDRGHWHCRRICAMLARKRSLARSSRKYRETESGREAHRSAQRTYRSRNQIKQCSVIAIEETHVDNPLINLDIPNTEPVLPESVVSEDKDSEIQHPSAILETSVTPLAPVPASGTIDGETHALPRSRPSVTHFPYCKFCSQVITAVDDQRRYPRRKKLHKKTRRNSRAIPGNSS